MTRRTIQCRGAVISLVVASLFTTTPVLAQSGAKDGEWRHWGADGGTTHYSPLDQIDRDNVGDLQIAWRWRADNFGPRLDFEYRATPLMVGGMLYTTAGSRRDVVAIDGATGETLWMFRYDEGSRGQRAPNRGPSGRGLAYWADGQGNERLFYVSLGYRLVALNPKTGRPVPDFGQDGVVDLWEGLDQDKTPQEGDFSLTSPPAVIGDVVVVGAAMRQSAIAGFPRGFDVRNGQRLWTFHTIPQQDEFGNDSWEGDSWRHTGNTGVWAPISVDEDLGYVYLGVETPTNDWYGGHRLGDNLFANSLVCVDAKTGERVWHFQLTHHDIWDYDIPAAANLVDITVDGKTIKAVAQVSKQAFTYVFDRITGEPVWPIAETPVPASGIPGERASPTQPFPTKPPPFRPPGDHVRGPHRSHPRAAGAGARDGQGVPTRVALHPDAAHRGGGDAGHTDAAVGQWRCQLAGRGGRSGNGYPLYPVDHECLAAGASAPAKDPTPSGHTSPPVLGRRNHRALPRLWIRVPVGHRHKCLVLRCAIVIRDGRHRLAAAALCRDIFDRPIRPHGPVGLQRHLESHVAELMLGGLPERAGRRNLPAQIQDLDNVGREHAIDNPPLRLSSPPGIRSHSEALVWQIDASL